MKFKYTATEPCRVGAVLVKTGDIWEWPEAPDKWWVPVEEPQEVQRSRPKPAFKAEE